MGYSKNRPNIVGMYNLFVGHEDETKVCKHCGKELPYECFISWRGEQVMGICHTCASRAGQNSHKEA